jgi:hypothetical protein
MAMAGGLSDESSTVAGPGTSMTRKEVLSHLAWWNWEVPPAIERIKRGETPFWVNVDMDRLNEAISQEHRDWTLASVIEYLAQSHNTMVEAVSRLSSEEVSGGSGGYDLPRLLTAYIEHYQEHGSQLA